VPRDWAHPHPRRRGVRILLCVVTRPPPLIYLCLSFIPTYLCLLACAALLPGTHAAFISSGASLCIPFPVAVGRTTVLLSPRLRAGTRRGMLQRMPRVAIPHARLHALVYCRSSPARMGARQGSGPMQTPLASIHHAPLAIRGRRAQCATLLLRR
jgi:hypothetical protein